MEKPCPSIRQREVPLGQQEMELSSVLCKQPAPRQPVIRTSVRFASHENGNVGNQNLPQMPPEIVEIQNVKLGLLNASMQLATSQKLLGSENTALADETLRSLALADEKVGLDSENLPDDAYLYPLIDQKDDGIDPVERYQRYGKYSWSGSGLKIELNDYNNAGDGGRMHYFGYGNKKSGNTLKELACRELPKFNVRKLVDGIEFKTGFSSLFSQDNLEERVEPGSRSPSNVKSGSPQIGRVVAGSVADDVQQVVVIAGQKPVETVSKEVGALAAKAAEPAPISPPVHEQASPNSVPQKTAAQNQEYSCQEAGTPAGETAEPKPRAAIEAPSYQEEMHFAILRNMVTDDRYDPRHKVSVEDNEQEAPLLRPTIPRANSIDAETLERMRPDVFDKGHSNDRGDQHRNGGQHRNDHRPKNRAPASAFSAHGVSSGLFGNVTVEIDDGGDPLQPWSSTEDPLQRTGRSTPNWSNWQDAPQAGQGGPKQTDPHSKREFPQRGPPGTTEQRSPHQKDCEKVGAVRLDYVDEPLPSFEKERGRKVKEKQEPFSLDLAAKEVEADVDRFRTKERVRRSTAPQISIAPYKITPWHAEFHGEHLPHEPCCVAISEKDEAFRLLRTYFGDQCKVRKRVQDAYQGYKGPLCTNQNSYAHSLECRASSEKLTVRLKSYGKEESRTSQSRKLEKNIGGLGKSMGAGKCLNRIVSKTGDVFPICNEHTKRKRRIALPKPAVVYYNPVPNPVSLNPATRYRNTNASLGICWNDPIAPLEDVTSATNPGLHSHSKRRRWNFELGRPETACGQQDGIKDRPASGQVSWQKKRPQTSQSTARSTRRSPIVTERKHRNNPDSTLVEENNNRPDTRTQLWAPKENGFLDNVNTGSVRNILAFNLEAIAAAGSIASNSKPGQTQPDIESSLSSLQDYDDIKYREDIMRMRLFKEKGYFTSEFFRSFIKDKTFWIPELENDVDQQLYQYYLTGLADLVVAEEKSKTWFQDCAPALVHCFIKLLSILCCENRMHDVAQDLARNLLRSSNGNFVPGKSAQKSFHNKALSHQTIELIKSEGDFLMRLYRLVGAVQIKSDGIISDLRTISLLLMFAIDVRLAFLYAKTCGDENAFFSWFSFAQPGLPGLKEVDADFSKNGAGSLTQSSAEALSGTVLLSQSMASSPPDVSLNSGKRPKFLTVAEILNEVEDFPDTTVSCATDKCVNEEIKPFDYDVANEENKQLGVSAIKMDVCSEPHAYAKMGVSGDTKRQEDGLKSYVSEDPIEEGFLLFRRLGDIADELDTVTKRGQVKILDPIIGRSSQEMIAAFSSTHIKILNGIVEKTSNKTVDGGIPSTEDHSKASNIVESSGMGMQDLVVFNLLYRPQSNITMHRLVHQLASIGVPLFVERNKKN